MCTVTIVPLKNNDFVLTSNRDEATHRKSIAPEFYEVDGTKLLYPRDELAGGTWVGVSEKNRVICVLNGGFEWHERKPKYRMSRGVLAKDFMLADNIVETIEAYSFKDIEPFTIVLVDWNTSMKFYELVWDGESKHFSELPLKPKIWSSSTLYNSNMRQERLQWFEDFKSKNKLDSKTLSNFHRTSGKYNDYYGVIMNRGIVKTTSITQVEKRNDIVEMRYENLQNNKVYTHAFNLTQIVNE